MPPRLNGVRHTIAAIHTKEIMNKHTRFPDIEGLHNIVKMFNKYEYMRPTSPITYKGKIKLHGTNSAVRVYTDGSVTAQSRENDITPEKDNAGFAKWVKEHFLQFCQLRGEQQVTIFGEFCGKGINAGCAIHQVDKHFAVFMVQIGDNETGTCIVEPDEIAQLFGQFGIDFLKVLPWYAPAEIVLDYSDQEQLRNQAEKINALITEVEKCDPWVKQTYGVEGVGEGIVYYPIGYNERTRFSHFVFKAKGSLHSVKVQSAPVIVSPEVVKSVSEFVKTFVTENRINQAISVACNGELDRKLTKNFLSWICKDVQKESVVELEAAGLEWKQVCGAVQKAAQQQWLEKTTAI